MVQELVQIDNRSIQGFSSCHAPVPSSLGKMSSITLDDFLRKLIDQTEAAKGSRVAVHGSALEEVEQERDFES